MFAALVASSLALATGCAPDDADDSYCRPGDPAGQSARGAAPSSWSCLQLVTFTEDYAVPNSDVIVRAGDRFVMDASFGGDFYYFGPADEGVVRMVYYPGAPVELKPEATEGEYHLAVFADVELFSDDRLTEFACELSAGRLIPAGQGWGSGPAGLGARRFTSEALVDVCGVDTVYAADTQATIEGEAAIWPPLGLVLLPDASAWLPATSDLVDPSAAIEN